jgi:leucyl/phenylalanyl-tRNA---protein transferase
MALDIQFPDPNEAEDDGLVAVGGNLTADFLIAAYAQGIFPWFNEGEPLLWWSPNPRMVLFPKDFKCSKSLQQVIKSRKFKVRIDENFEDVIRSCAEVKRPGQRGTWITKDMIKAYTHLFQEGYAHSVETYQDDILVGGLYGISLGKAFFGESMFYIKRDASKIALFHLNELLLAWDFHFIDVQQSTNHLRSLGAVDIQRKNFLDLLKLALNNPTIKGKWSSV